MKRAIFYIADQPRYAREALVSANSIRRNKEMDFDICLFSPSPENWQENMLCYILPDRETDIFFYDHTRWMNIAFHALKEIGYKQVIYMDCDTYACDNFDEVFDLLDWFDMMGVHAPARQTTRTTSDLSLAFPEINLGFNPIRINKITTQFMDDFLHNYLLHLSVYGNNDQGAFRDTLYGYLTSSGVIGDFKFHTLPVEYNCRFNFPSAVAKTVKILHGHTSKFSAVENFVNSSEGMRSWKSNEIVD